MSALKKEGSLDEQSGKIDETEKTMEINEMHSSIKEQLGLGQSLSLSPEEIDRQINKAISDMFLQEYAHFEATQEITDTLGYFKKKEDKDADPNGLIDYPSDYHFVTGTQALITDTNIRPLDLVPDSEWAHKVVSKGFPPTAEYPIGRYIGENKLEVRPIKTTDAEGVTKVRFFYLKKPAIAKFGYTISSDGKSYVYAAGSSVQIDFPDISHAEIERKALAYLSINVGNPMAAQVEQIKKVTNKK